MKRDFIKSELWLLTVGGAFQRANIYKAGSDEGERNAFKNILKREVTTIATSYKKRVDEKDHLANIVRITEIKHPTLNNGNLNFGVSQKILNLYLKYMWCLGEIPTPPHFPVDRIIQQKLKMNPVIPWTQIVDVEQYMRIIDIARKRASDENCSLAELELNLFKRTNA